MPRQAGSRLSSQTLGIAEVECTLLPATEKYRHAAGAALREASRLFCRGLSVLWRPAHRSWFARHWSAAQAQAPCLRSASHACSKRPWRQFQAAVFSATSGPRKAAGSMRALRCSRAFYLPRAGAPGQAAQAVQPPASLVAVASGCLQAASPNAQCVQAVCRLARCLTLQSTGRRPAGRAPPVISNVRPHQNFRSKVRTTEKLLCAVNHPITNPLTAISCMSTVKEKYERSTKEIYL